MNQQDTGKVPEGGFLDAPQMVPEQFTIECPAVIWKYSFQVSDTVEIEMPRTARILHVDVQHGTPRLWALVDPTRAQVTRRLRLFGTGRPITGALGRYVGTFQQQAFVWHVFEAASL